MQCVLKGLCTGRYLVGFELHEHPECGLVDGHEQVAPTAPDRHPGRLLHVGVHTAWLIGLERLGDLPGRGRQQRPQAPHDVSGHEQGKASGVYLIIRDATSMQPSGARQLPAGHSTSGD